LRPPLLPNPRRSITADNLLTAGLVFTPVQVVFFATPIRRHADTASLLVAASPRCGLPGVGEPSRQSVCADQTAGLLSSQSPRNPGADAPLEATDSLASLWTKDAVRVPFVVTQAAQSLLYLNPVRPGHTGFVGHGRQRRAA
jgi:hypothetical protein